MKLKDEIERIMAEFMPIRDSNYFKATAQALADYILAKVPEKKECYKNEIDYFPSIMGNDQNIGYNQAIDELMGKWGER